LHEVARHDPEEQLHDRGHNDVIPVVVGSWQASPVSTDTADHCGPPGYLRLSDDSLLMLPHAKRMDATAPIEIQSSNLLWHLTCLNDTAG
jgi:hypothetical protein